MELKTNLEGKQTDESLDASTSASPEAEPELNSSPTPTQEEIEDANLSSEPSEPVQAEPINDEPEQTGENIEANVSNDNVTEENGVTETPIDELRYTQEQYQNALNDIAGRTRIETRQKTFDYIYSRYGVSDEAGLDELVGNAQRYDSLQEQYDTDRNAWKEQSSVRDKELADIKEQVALMQSGIDSDRFEDAKFILRGKGLDVSLDNINAELVTHPEWKKASMNANPNFAKVDETKPQQDLAEPASKISVLGNDNSKAQVDDEEAAAMRLFKV